MDLIVHILKISVLYLYIEIKIIVSENIQKGNFLGRIFRGCSRTPYKWSGSKKSCDNHKIPFKIPNNHLITLLN